MTITSDAVNAWVDDLTEGDHIIIAHQQRFGWEQIRVTATDAVQLADQLYLLTKADP